MGEEKPDSGFVRRGPSIKPAYLPQIVRFSHPRRTLVDSLIYGLNLSPQVARNRLGAFMFSGEEVFKLVGDLSGGEKSRLRLCMLMNGEINLLVLDEPTNHLDLPSREWIEDAVDQYGETLIFISHDRYFINRFATRIWELEDGVFTDFDGAYSDYLAYKAQDTSVEQEKKEPSVSPKTKRKPADTQKQLRRLEREIGKLENELDEISLLKEENSSSYERLLELDKHEQEVMESLDKLYAQWERSAE